MLIQSIYFLIDKLFRYMDKGFGDNFKKSNNQKEFSIKGSEISSQTKKAIFLAREGKLLESAKIYNDLINEGHFNHITFHRLAGLYEKLGKKKKHLNAYKKPLT